MTQEEKAPEKIWVHELSTKELNVPFKEYHVEYTRTDTFIEKACEWLKKYGGGYWMDDYDLPTDELVNDFRNYMKGE